MKIETKRLILRNYTENDFDDYWEYVSQPNVYPRSNWPAYTEKSKAMEQLKREISRPLQFAIELKDCRKVVGSIALIPARDLIIQQLNCKIEEVKELSYLLNERFWGKGIMTEAAQAIIKYGFDYLGLRVIVAGYYKPNASSEKVLLKCGLYPFLTTKNSAIWYKSGKYVDAINCKITKKEYKNIDAYKSVNITVVND